MNFVQPRLLIVDDDQAILDSLAERFEARGYKVTTAETGADAVACADGTDVMLLDLQLPAGDGLWVLERLAEVETAPSVVVITAHGTVGRAVEAMKSGAYDFLEKPFAAVRVEEAVARAWERSKLLTSNRVLRGEATAPGFIYADSAMKAIVEVARRAAASTATVLILGQSGTGKEVMARAIHSWSDRADGPFVAVNCAAISESLLESELFGHEAGAFTGAESRRMGRIESSHGGTLFLDEIGDTSPAFQKRLLRVLQERSFERVGGTKSIDVDLRCIAATNKDLKAQVATGSFREDLFYRLHVIALELPTLAKRRADIGLLARHFVQRFGLQLGRPNLHMAPACLAALEAYGWPGNIRELSNVIERAAVLSLQDEIQVDDLHPDIGTPALHAAEPSGFHAQVETFRRETLAAALKRHDGHQTKAAASLFLQRSYFARLLKKYGLV
ncbi:MAG: two-component system response regulator AtoC [Bacteroidia bacterium]